MNDSILTHVGQSKKNIYTDTRIENSHDEDRGISITGFFKYGNQYKELHEEHIRNGSILTHVGQSKKISIPIQELRTSMMMTGA